MHTHQLPEHTSKSKTFWLSLMALGVVYGDIGTSPLYAINEIFFGHSHLQGTSAEILGGISLVIWAVTLIVSFKYVVYVLRADNEGEGGVFALYGLLEKKKIKKLSFLALVLILAAGLLLGDGIITPAISVISAIEGLNVATTAFQAYVVPITIAILTGLFLIQRGGTAKIGRVFGPIIAVWFVAIGLIGLKEIIAHPTILQAINPIYAAQFIVSHPLYTVMVVLGSVMLVVTGGEAMYADMGHFGRLPIRLSWFSLTYPALILNYLGQGAYLLSGKAVISGNIFYSMVPGTYLYPMVVLATMATIIASQALISGAYSLIMQAISLGLVPQLQIIHTHEDNQGQIYIPTVNWALYIGCIILVFAFRSSSAMASAYGLAVSGVMLITSINMVAIARYYWKWSRVAALGLFIPLSVIDAAFLTSNSLKILEGGYIPLCIGIAFLVIVKIWRWGRNTIESTYRAYDSMTVKELISIKQKQLASVPQSVVVMTPAPVVSLTERIPLGEQVFYERYGFLPKHLVLLNVQTTSTPHVHGKRYAIKEFYNDQEKGSITGVTLNFGFMEAPDVEANLEELVKKHLVHMAKDHKRWVIHVIHERINTNSKVSIFTALRYQFFKILAKNSDTADYYFGLGQDVPLAIDIVPVTIA